MINNPLIFLDIDGVLNGHEQFQNGYCGVKLGCIEVLNRIIGTVDARIVIISAWRYMILRGEMTIQGFSGMMCTHGLKWGSIIDIVGPDLDAFKDDRAILIEKWFSERLGVIENRSPYLVIDDQDLGYTKRNMPFFKTDGNYGLKEVEIWQLIEILKTK